MQFSTLLQLGIDICEALGGDLWTDYNEHDPGVTMLEQLSYAITDLGYRVNYPVPDILAETNIHGQPSDSALFTGDTVLCCDPIAALDFRKLACDRAKQRRLSNFKNLWFNNPATGAGGVHDVLIETWDGNDDPNVVAEIAATLQAHRALGDDLGTVAVLPVFGLQVTATLSISATASPDAVLAAVLYQLQNALVPFVRFNSVDQLMQQGVPPDQIYVGPRLTQGALADDQFVALPTTVSLRGLSTAILSVEGVESVTGLSVNGQQSGSVPIPSNRVARLQPSIFVPQTAWPIKVVRSDKPATIDATRVSALIAQHIAADAVGDSYALQSSQRATYTSLPPGQFKDISQYYSLQRQFPLTYGIGAYGVALRQTLSRVTVAERNIRVSQAKQLKAFLLFFEQILADGFTQLANGPRLLSLDSALDRSYFWQPLVALTPDILRQYPWQRPVNPDLAPPNVVEWKILRSANAPPPVPEDRRYTVQIGAGNSSPQRILRSGEYPSLSDATAAQQQMLDLGQSVSNYQVRSLPNGETHLLLADADGKAIGFGIQRYASRQDAENEARRLALYMHDLANDPALRKKNVVIVVRGTLALELVDNQGQILLSAGDLTRDEQNQRVTQWLQLGVHPDHYQIVPAGRASFRLFLRNRSKQPVGKGAEYFSTIADAEAAIAQLVALFQSLCCDAATQALHILRVPRPPAPEPDDAVLQYAIKVDRLTRQFDPYAQRRNRFLDHLLARFSEAFADDELIAFDPRNGVHREQCERDLIASKIDFLQHYPQAQLAPVGSTYAASLGAGRSRGANYTKAEPEQSGLERRLKLLLGFDSATNNAATAPSAEWAYLAVDAGNTGATVNRSLESGGSFVFASNDPAIFQALLRDGTAAENYSIAEGRSSGTVSVMFAWSDGSAPAEVFRAPTKAAAQQAIDALCVHLRALSEDSAGIHAYEELYVVEHVLLRPSQPTATAGIPPADFYDYRISAVLPSWAARFQHPGFRDLAEQLLAENCPAHLLAECHWLDRPAMAKFKQLYRQWRALKHTVPADLGKLDQTALALAKFLFDLETGVPA
jgi:hypothetical protein